MNSGDWVESLTAVVEHWDGRYELVTFADFIQQFPFEAEEIERDDVTLLVTAVAER